MKRYLSSALVILSAATTFGILIHTINRSSIAHANSQSNLPISPLAQIADSLRGVSLGLDATIMELHAIDSTLGTHLHVGLESMALADLQGQLPLPSKNLFGSILPSAPHLYNRIDRQQQYIDSVNVHLAERRALIAHLPTMMPCQAQLSSSFGQRFHPIDSVWKIHEGLDFAAPEGTPILAAGAGIVSMADTINGYGSIVEIDHGFGYRSRYAHCSRLIVATGDTVRRGDLLALVGSTGESTGPHLHFEIIVDETKIDPLLILRAPLPPSLKSAAQGTMKRRHRSPEAAGPSSRIPRRDVSRSGPMVAIDG